MLAIDEQVLKELWTELCVLRKLYILLSSLFEEFLALKNHLSPVLLKNELQGREGYMIRKSSASTRYKRASPWASFAVGRSDTFSSQEPPIPLSRGALARGNGDAGTWLADFFKQRFCSIGEASRTDFYIWCCFLCIQVSFGNWETKET